jgi:hypothetical protein
MNTTDEALLPESCPAGLNCRLGVIRSRSWVCTICRFSSVSALKAEMATGVFCSVSSRRRAVTTMALPCASSAAGWTAASGELAAAVSSLVCAAAGLAAASSAIAKLVAAAPARKRCRNSAVRKVIGILPSDALFGAVGLCYCR